MKVFKMRCKHCGYTYSVTGEPSEWELCPICGHSAPFQEFVVETDIKEVSND